MYLGYVPCRYKLDRSQLMWPTRTLRWHWCLQDPHLSHGATGALRRGQESPSNDFRQAQAPFAVDCKLYPPYRMRQTAQGKHKIKGHQQHRPVRAEVQIPGFQSSESI